MARRKGKQSNQRGSQRRSSTRNQRKKKGNRITKAPSATSRQLRNRNPLSTLRFKNREFLRDVSGDGSSSKIEHFTVNPGQSSVFSWLSQIAGAFEFYKFNSLKFMYYPAAASTQNGSIALCPEYDVSDADSNELLLKRDLLQFKDSVRASIWSECTLLCSHSDLNVRKRYFIREESDAVSELADVAMIYIVLSNVASGVGGELWVEYDVTLSTPQTGEAHMDQAFGNLDGNISASYPFINVEGELMTLKSTDEGVFLATSGDKIYFTEPNKQYQIEWVGTDSQIQITNAGRWGSAVNAVISYVYDAITDHTEGTGFRAVSRCTVDTNADVTADNPASITIGSTTIGGTYLEFSYLSIVETLAGIFWDTF